MKKENQKKLIFWEHFEITMGFCIVLLLVTFSATEAQTTPPIPTLPVNGQTTLQTPRPDTSLLNPDYSLTDHLSWNPINNLQAVYNYTTWNVLGTYSSNIGGTDYTFHKLDNGGVQASYTDSYGNNTTIAKNNWDDGTSTLTSSLLSGKNSYVSTQYQDGSSIEKYIPAQGDAFTKKTDPEGKTELGTFDPVTGMDRVQQYDENGDLERTKYLGPDHEQPDGSVSTLVMRPLTAEENPLDKTALVGSNTTPISFIDNQQGNPWNVQWETKDSNGKLISSTDLVYNDASKQWEETEILNSKQIVDPSKTDTQYSGEAMANNISGDKHTWGNEWSAPQNIDENTMAGVQSKPNENENSTPSASGQVTPDAMSNKSNQIINNNPEGSNGNDNQENNPSETTINNEPQGAPESIFSGNQNVQPTDNNEIENPNPATIDNNPEGSNGNDNQENNPSETTINNGGTENSAPEEDFNNWVDDQSSRFIDNGNDNQDTIDNNNDWINSITPDDISNISFDNPPESFSEPSYDYSGDSGDYDSGGSYDSGGYDSGGSYDSGGGDDSGW